jgi:ribonuclease T
MKKKYISVDIEASGKTPGKYSMLSIGACIVGNTSIQFYEELKPIIRNYNLESMKIACLGLKCLEKYKHLPEYDPKNCKFNPDLVLDLLDKEGKDPKKVMNDFADWIIQNIKGFAAVEAASPIKFDGMFTAWYFDNFYEGENPLGFSGEDINSMYRGLKKNIHAHTGTLLSKDIPHNALEDAIVQAKRFEIVLKEMGIEI